MSPVTMAELDRRSLARPSIGPGRGHRPAFGGRRNEARSLAEERTSRQVALAVANAQSTAFAPLPRCLLGDGFWRSRPRTHSDPDPLSAGWSSCRSRLDILARALAGATPVDVAKTPPDQRGQFRPVLLLGYV